MKKKTRSESQKKGDKGEREVSKFFTETEWLVTKIPQGNDFGDDQLVHVFNDDTVTEMKFLTQVKSRSNVQLIDNKFYSVSFSTIDLDIWRGSVNPFFIILWNSDNKIAYWIEIHHYLSNLPKSIGWEKQDYYSINFPIQNKLDDKGLKKIERIVRKWYLNLGIKVRGLDGIKLNTRFEFPNTESGHKARLEIIESIETGKGFEINDSNIFTVDFPNWVKRITGLESVTASFLSVFPIPANEKFTAKFSVFNEANEEVTNELFVFRITQGGTKEITFENDTQESILKIKIILNKETDRIDINFRFNFHGISSKSLKEKINFIKALSSGMHTELREIETGQLFISGKPNMVPDENFLYFLGFCEKIVFISEKLNLELIIALDDDYERQIELIEYIYQAISSGLVKTIFKPMELSIDRNRLLDEIKRKPLETFQLRAVSKYIEVEIFSKKINLGPMTRHWKSVKYSDGLDTITEQLTSSTSKEIKIKFIPSESKDVEDIFDDYYQKDK